MEVRFCDETDFGFGWIAAEPRSMERASHALVAAGVWVIDPVDGPGVEERILALGEPRGVLMLLDRHRRDCETYATRLSVPLHETPFDGVPGAPFSFIAVVRNRLWRCLENRNKGWGPEFKGRFKLSKGGLVAKDLGRLNKRETPRVLPP